MSRTHLLSLSVTVLFLAACADNPIVPEARVVAPEFSSAVAAPSTHIVQLRGNGPRDLEASVTALGGRVLYQSAGAGFALVDGLDAAGAATLASARGVGAVLEDPVVQLAAAPMLSNVELLAVEAMSPGNPAGAFRHSYQWNMRTIDADDAWAAGELGSAGVTVAILDSGIDYDGYDMNGVVDLSRSVSFVPSDDALMAAWFPDRHPVDDLNGHGTNVATQVSSNAVIFAGVASQTQLIGVKVLGASGSGSLGGILAGLAYAADVGADVANMSLGVEFGVSKPGNGSFIGITNQIFNYAHRQGMVVVVSAGNDLADMDSDVAIFRAYCDAPHVVCVSATGPTASANPFTGPFLDVDALAPYSNFGKNVVTVSAPGGTSAGYVASVCARHYTVMTAGGPVFPCNAPPGYFVTIGYAGTSQAAPHVAGLAALLVGQLGANNPSQIVHAITRGADDIGDAGNDASFGRGRINVANSLGL